MLKEICSENPEAMAAYNRLSDEQKEKAEIGCYMIGQALSALIPIIGETIKAVQELAKSFAECSPDKRVVHLSLYGRKQRTRKKNMNRIKKAFRKSLGGLQNG